MVFSYRKMPIYTDMNIFQGGAAREPGQFFTDPSTQALPFVDKTKKKATVGDAVKVLSQKVTSLEAEIGSIRVAISGIKQDSQCNRSDDARTALPEERNNMLRDELHSALLVE
ncbi:hypothetical protein VNI00_016427 [Paramarasmius palmivorus]|uniref:Uncharacterized protein n=1 Tax=Paramarasmius palmivorus TaxID=297713 RepID=A0AAW0BCX3_9AGAR